MIASSHGRNARGRQAEIPAAPMRRCRSREIDLEALQAVIRASAEGRKEGRQQALDEVTLAHAGQRRRARTILGASVITALLLGFTVGMLAGALAPSPHPSPEPSGACR